MAKMPKRKPSSTLKIAVAGAQGRMGRAVLSAASMDPDASVAAGWERPGNPDLGRDLGASAGLPNLGVPLAAGPVVEGVDLIIDFTSPESTLAILAAISRSGRRPALVV